MSIWNIVCKSPSRQTAWQLAWLQGGEGWHLNTQVAQRPRRPQCCSSFRAGPKLCIQAAGYTTQMRFLKTLSLNKKHLALDYKAKQTSGSFLLCLKSSLSSRFLHSTNVCRTLRDLLAEAGPLGPAPFVVRMGGTFLGRNKNNTTQRILISNCQACIRESGLDIARLPNWAIWNHLDSLWISKCWEIFWRLGERSGEKIDWWL